MRRVASAAGARFYGLPIGAVITDAARTKVINKKGPEPRGAVKSNIPIDPKVTPANLDKMSVGDSVSMGDYYVKRTSSGWRAGAKAKPKQVLPLSVIKSSKDATDLLRKWKKMRNDLDVKFSTKAKLSEGPSDEQIALSYVERWNDGDLAR